MFRSVRGFCQSSSTLHQAVCDRVETGAPSWERGDNATRERGEKPPVGGMIWRETTMLRVDLPRYLPRSRQFWVWSHVYQPPSGWPDQANLKACRQHGLAICKDGWNAFSVLQILLLKTLFSREILYCVLAEIVVLLIHRLIWGFFHLGPEFELTSLKRLDEGRDRPCRRSSNVMAGTWER